MRKPKKYAFGEEMLTIDEIRQRTGMSRNAITRRIKDGIDLRLSKFANYVVKRYPFHGLPCTACEIAKALGKTPQWVRLKIRANADLDTYEIVNYFNSPVQPISAPNLFDDSVRADEEPRFQQAHSYMKTGKPLMSDDEIRAEFSDLGRLSDDGVAWARDMIRHFLFAHGGDTLQLIGDFFGVSRERIRQIEAKARIKCRRKADRSVQDDLELMDEIRTETFADKMARMAPGNSELRSWEAAHSATVVAKRIGAPIDKKAIASNKRGGEATARMRRRSAA